MCSYCSTGFSNKGALAHRVPGVAQWAFRPRQLENARANMSVKGGPDLRRYMDKKLALRLNAGRRVTGVLRGFDQFMNLVLDETIEEVSASERNEIGMVVIRGNSVTMIECLERTVLVVCGWL